MDDAFEKRLAARTARVDALTARWVRGPDTGPYRALVVAWAVACVARLTLLEPAHGWWWAATLLLLAAAVGLLRYGGRIWWGLSWIALAWPYLFLRDWMTQSLVMLLVATAGLLTARGGRDGAPDAAPHDAGDTVRRAAHLITVLTYVAAAFHKLNRDFFAPDLGCGAYGWTKLSTFFGASGPWPGGDLLNGAAVPGAIVTTELAIAVLLFRRHPAVLPLALLFHLPLTLVLAPAFVFVMALGFVAMLDDEDLRVLRRTPWLHRTALATTAVFAAIGLARGDVVLGTKVGLILTGTAAGVHLWRLRPARRPPIGATGHRRPRRRPDLAVALAALFAVNAATPYVGVQFQHTGAMLSNLRIDAGCWNHLLVPESIRRVDPYLRIDSASIGPVSRAATVQGPVDADTAAGTADAGPPRTFAERERILRETLWAPSALRLIRRNWCRPHTTPIAIAGTLLGEPFVIDDLCDPTVELPRGVGLHGGSEWFPDFLKLQKNLTRACPTACIH